MDTKMKTYVMLKKKLRRGIGPEVGKKSIITLYTDDIKDIQWELSKLTLGNISLSDISIGSLNTFNDAMKCLSDHEETLHILEVNGIMFWLRPCTRVVYP